MPTNVFISFAREDLEQVNSIRALAKDPKHELEFHDRSELDPVKDKVGTPLPYQPDDTRAAPIRNKIRGLLRKATKMVVIIGENTCDSDWVNWEIQTFYDQKKNLPGDATKRIMGMYVKGCEKVELPKRVRGLEILTMAWSLTLLNKWLNTNPNQQS